MKPAMSVNMIAANLHCSVLVRMNCASLRSMRSCTLLTNSGKPQKQDGFLPSQRLPQRLLHASREKTHALHFWRIWSTVICQRTGSCAGRDSMDRNQPRTFRLNLGTPASRRRFVEFCSRRSFPVQLADRTLALPG